MKNRLITYLLVSFTLVSFPVLSQTENDTTALGLPGDNLDLYAVLNVFQQSKTIEDFEKSLNDEKTKINNLDLNLDKKVDFIKVTTKQDDEDFTFILQVDVAEKETQDVAVILLSKDDNDKVTLQIVGDEDLYGEDYVVEPKPPVTVNPGYTGSDPVKVEKETTVVVVESAPIVQYVYSPAYVPYYPPYYYGYYPPYFAAFTVMAVGIYRHNHYYHHHGYHGGYHGGGAVVVRNTNVYNNYNNSRNRSSTVDRNNSRGSYGQNNVSNRQNRGTTTNKPTNNMSKGTSNNMSRGTSNNMSKGTSNNMSKGTSTSKNRTSNNVSKGPTSTTRKSTSTGTSRNRSNFGGGSRGGGGGGRRR
jgi:hypothetical protein